jgi:hypothetical protein
VERAQPSVERPVAVAVAPGEPIGRALVPSRADEAIDVGLHQDLQHGLGHRPQEIAVAALL